MASAAAGAVRSTLIDVLKTPYVEFARAKGLQSATVIRKHVLPNSLISVVTIGLVVARAVNILQ